MRAEPRRDTHEIWVIDRSPEGHQPKVETRVFQGVRHPVCIVSAIRRAAKDPRAPARVRFRSLPKGRREDKFAAAAEISLSEGRWVDCPNEWRMPFLPTATGDWADFVSLADLFVYNGSGVMPGGTWVIAPDVQSPRDRWRRLAAEKDPIKKEVLFHPHEGGDRSVDKAPRAFLPNSERGIPNVTNDNGDFVSQIQYGFRTFDRRWIIHDARSIDRPNPTILSTHSISQIYPTSLMQHSPMSGPSVSFTALIPDLDHYNGRGGRAFPLWADNSATVANFPPASPRAPTSRLETTVGGEDLFAYTVGLLARPAFTRRYQPELVQPGLRVPLTADPTLFVEAAEIGRRVVWLHTFGERFVDSGAGRPAGPPRPPSERAPRVPREGRIPEDADTIDFDAANGRLSIGSGFVTNVAKAM